MISGRRVRRGWLGVSVAALDPVMASRLGLGTVSGVIVNAVAEGSPAYNVGISRGDVITECDGEAVETEEDLFYRTYTRRPGERVKLAYIGKRGKKQEELVLAERPARDAEVLYTSGKEVKADRKRGRGFSWEGLELSFEEGGAVVERISPDSKLLGYLRRGDRIKAVNKLEISSSAGFQSVFSGAKISEGVVFYLERDGEGMYISVQAK